MPNLFDERVVISIILTWSLIISVAIIGIVGIDILTYGPSSKLFIFDIPIDTWSKWSVIVVYIIINQCIETYGLNTISPWLINDIQNKNIYTRKYSKTTIQFINIFWTLYLWLSYVISLRLYFTQFDFLCLLLIMDCLTGILTTHKYLKYKTVYQKLYCSVYDHE